MRPSSRHAARSRRARHRPAGGAPGLSSSAGRLISVVRPLKGIPLSGKKLLVAALLLSAACTPLRDPDSPAVFSAQSLDACLFVQADPVPVGEALKLELRLANLWSRSISVFGPGTCGEMHSVRLRFTPPGGNAFQVFSGLITGGPHCFCGRDAIVLLPGETACFPVRPYWTMSTPGEYLLQGNIRVRFGGGPSEEMVALIQPLRIQVKS